MKVVVVGDVVVASPTVLDPAVQAVFGAAELVIGNLELPLVDGGHQAEKEVTLRADVTMAAELTRMGFHACTLANNHAMDYGIEGLRSTIRALDGAGIARAGGGENADEAFRGVDLTGQDGTRVALLSLCSAVPLGANATSVRPGIAAVRVGQSYEIDAATLEEQPGTPPYVRTAAREVDVVRAERAIHEAKSRADRVVVAIHWGVPWWFMPPNQGPLAEYQRPLGHRLVDAGADVVVGHHPHCLHPIERYGDGVILYSTGNFLFHTHGSWGPPEPRPSAPYGSPPLTGPWSRSAMFEIDFGTRPPGIRLFPIELTRIGEPVVVPGTDILREVAEMSSGVDGVDVDGFVRFH